MFKKPRFQLNSKIIHTLFVLYVKLLGSPGLVNCLNNGTPETINDSQDNLAYLNQTISIEESEAERDRKFYDNLSKFNI